MFTRIDRDSFVLFKTALRTIWSDVGSSHADEALAAYFGYRTYASLLAVLPAAPDFLDTEPDPAKLVARLSALGHSVPTTDVDRLLRLFRAEMMARMSEGFLRMASKSANDNGPAA
ncbi:MAG: hypothetical protein ACOH2N_12485 [Devosia sp.]